MASELLEFEEDDDNHGDNNTPMTPTGGFQNSAEIDVSAVKVGKKRLYDNRGDTPNNMQAQNKSKINGIAAVNTINNTFDSDKKNIEQSRAEHNIILKVAEDIKA